MIKRSEINPFILEKVPIEGEYSTVNMMGHDARITTLEEELAQLRIDFDALVAQLIALTVIPPP